MHGLMWLDEWVNVCTYVCVCMCGAGSMDGYKNISIIYNTPMQLTENRFAVVGNTAIYLIVIHFKSLVRSTTYSQLTISCYFLKHSG
jgi:hypothetical protein